MTSIQENIASKGSITKLLNLGVFSKRVQHINRREKLNHGNIPRLADYLSTFFFGFFFCFFLFFSRIIVICNFNNYKIDSQLVCNFNKSKTLGIHTNNHTHACCLKKLPEIDHKPLKDILYFLKNFSSSIKIVRIKNAFR